MQKFPVDELKRWFLDSRRDLPWRNDPTPYGVWVSEIMLQQTQVAVVTEYYKRWMVRFPNIESLSKASIEEVIKQWEGLGYYSRARSLHLGAQYIMKHCGGQLPCNRIELEKIPGIGPYTVGAILSFAFHQKAAAVDGNVVRVLTRFAAIEEDVCTAKVKKKIWEIAEAILPDEEPWQVVEGLIELGATVCAKQPKCYLCPLSQQCQGLKRSIADLLPIKKKKVEISQLYRQVAVVVSEGFFLLSKGEKGNVMADLYEFPYTEGKDRKELGQYLIDVFGLSVSHLKDLEAVQHSFTRYRAILYPSVWEASNRVKIKGCEWVPAADLKNLPFSAGHRRVLNFFQN